MAIVAIIAIMVTASIVNVRQGQDAARVKAAARDIFALIRHARANALLSQQPSILTYSTETLDDEPVARVTITSAKLLKVKPGFDAETIEGHGTVRVGGEDASEGEGGETLEDILFAPISTDVVRGLKLKVVVGENAELEYETEEQTKSKISVFSTTDYLLGRFAEAQQKAEKKESETTSLTSAAEAEESEPVSIVWEVNGRTTAHRLWIYPDGQTPEKGLSIKVDRYGAAKILSAEDE